MCTVVCRWVVGEPLRILALRDEFVGRDFDEPSTWWPEQPTVVGGRDRAAGGSWCVSDVATGRTALLVNRTERLTGTPTRGLLPLAAVAHGPAWTEHVDHHDMASFNLVLAGPADVVVWTWDGAELRRLDLTPGTHLVTSYGVDADDAKSVRFGPSLRTEPWPDVVTACTPEADESALVVEREYDGRTYATIFGQLITAGPGRLVIEATRTPWLDGTWTTSTW